MFNLQENFKGFTNHVSNILKNLKGYKVEVPQAENGSSIPFCFCISQKTLFHKSSKVL